MSQWLNQAIARAESLQNGLSSQQDGLWLRRQQSLQQLRNRPWPGRKNESWKYTSLKALEQLQLPTVAANTETLVDPIADLDTLDLIFVNGKLQNLPGQETLGEGLAIFELSDNQHQSQLNQVFAKVKPSRHYFGLVNDVLAMNGVMIDVANGATIDRPVRVVNIINQGVEAHTRVLVRLGDKASLTVIEQCIGEQGIGDSASVNTLFSEYQLGAHARLNHYRFALQSDGAIALGGAHFNLATGSQLDANLVAIGSRLSRLDVDINHRGEFAKANLNAIYLLDGEELFDLHSNVEHSVAHGETAENVRGIISGRARAVFNGRIHIHPHAQKTEATLNNRNLLLSPRAEVDTKPELEIYADDVRCAHGATVAQIDEKSLYYLQSRGIDHRRAQMMLNFGFINELIKKIPHPQIGRWLQPMIRQRFAHMALSSE